MDWTGDARAGISSRSFETVRRWLGFQGLQTDLPIIIIIIILGNNKSALERSLMLILIIHVSSHELVLDTPLLIISEIMRELSQQHRRVLQILLSVA